MKHLSGYGAYRLFLALRSHFQNENYDFVKYQGKVRASKVAYDKRHDKYFFEKLSKQYDAMELRDFFISNIIEGNTYVTNMLDETAHSHYINHQSYKQSQTYRFGGDLDVIYKKGVLATFTWKKGEYPLLLLLYIQRQISLETLVILDDLTPSYRNKFNKHLQDDVMWSVIRLQIDKMKAFVKYDKDKVMSILKDKINEFNREKQKAKEVSTKEKAYREAI